MKTCETCICWRRVGHSPVHRRVVYDTGVKIIPPGEEGECRRAGPIEDFRWALTSAGDYCAEHKASGAGTAVVPANGATAGKTPGGGEPAAAVDVATSQSTAHKPAAFPLRASPQPASPTCARGGK